jgi:hypothetical protein
VGNFRVLARVSFYDEWYDSFENDVFGTDAVFDSEYLLDLEVEYTIGDHSSILIGGNNVFDDKAVKKRPTSTILASTVRPFSVTPTASIRPLVSVAHSGTHAIATTSKL